MRHLFILNQYAGTEDTTSILKKEIEKLNIQGEVFIEYTKKHRDGERIVKEYLEKSDDFLRVYACGGDGTANEVAQNMVNKDNCAMGVVPVGTGNDFVRSIGPSSDTFRDLQKMVDGEIEIIDTLKCEDMYSINSVTAGYDCAVADKAQDFKRWPFMNGSLAYKLSIFYCLFTKRVHTFRVFANNKEVNLCQGYKTPMLTVAANGKYYGGGIKCTPLADFKDGMIDFMLIPTVPVLKFVSLLSTFISGNHINNPKLPMVTHFKTKKIQLIDDKKVRVGIDGEMLEYKNPTIEVIEKALKIIVPKGK